MTSFRFSLEHGSELGCCVCNRPLEDVDYIEAVRGDFEAFACCSELCAMALTRLDECAHGLAIKELV